MRKKKAQFLFVFFPYREVIPLKPDIEKEEDEKHNTEDNTEENIVATKIFSESLETAAKVFQERDEKGPASM